MDEFDRRIRNQRGIDSDDSDDGPPKQVRLPQQSQSKKIEDLQR